MNFNDKFLNVCFKMGKVLFSGLLILSLLTSVIFLCRSAYQAVKVNQTNITYKYDVYDAFNNLYSDIFNVEDLTENNNSNTESKVNKEVQKAKKLIEEFAKEQGFENIEYSLPSDSEQAFRFVKGFIAYYDDFVKEFKTLLITKSPQKMTPENADKFIKANKYNIYKDAMSSYAEAYSNEIDAIATQKNVNIIDRNSSFTAFLISLGVFILFLFLPILLRIEENTRKG